MMPLSGPGRVRGERGSVIVEAAIIVPLLILLTFGAIEYGIAFQESSAVKYSTRAGARIASALPRQDYADSTRQAVDAALQGLGSATPQEMWVYRVAAGTDDDPEGLFGSCGNCVGYGWNAGTGRFNISPLSGSDLWQPSEQNACAGSADRIGVYVKARHDFITSLFGAAATLQSRTVMRLEPFVGEEGCSP